MQAIARCICVVALLMLISAPVGASDSTTVASGATATIDVHGTCKKVTNGSSASVYVPTVLATEWASFLAYPPSGITLAACSNVVAGSQTFATPGTGSFVVPAYNTLIVDAWGGGGGGGAGGLETGDFAYAPDNATSTTIPSLGLTAGRATVNVYGVGQPGTASGGDINESGQAAQSDMNGGNAGGMAYGGGAGSTTTYLGCMNPAPNAQQPGGGGAASGGCVWYGGTGYAGGGGGFVRKTYTFGNAGAPAVGATIAHTVGTRGSPGSWAGTGGYGGHGMIKYTWN